MVELLFKAFVTYLVMLIVYVIVGTITVDRPFNEKMADALPWLALPPALAAVVFVLWSVWSL